MSEQSPELLVPIADAENQAPPMQKLFLEGNILPGTNLSVPRLMQVVDELSTVTGMTLFDGPSIKTPTYYDAETFLRLGGKAPEDINVSWMWDDSGGQFYIFPERGHRLVLDLHTCKTFNAGAAITYLADAFNFRENMRFAEQTATDSSNWQTVEVQTPEVEHLKELEHILNIDIRDTESVTFAGELLEQLTFKALQTGWGNRFAALFNETSRARLREVHSAYEVTIDTRFNADVLSGKATNAHEYRFQSTYDRLAKMEVAAAGLKPGDHIVHVGSGWPGTAIGMFQEHGVAVTCIEIDPVVAEQSKRGLEKLGLAGSEKITVLNANGSNLNFSNFKVVLVSAMVPNIDKQSIRTNLSMLGGGRRMIVRQPAHAATGVFYQPLPTGFTKAPRDVVHSVTTPDTLDPLQSIIFEVGIHANPNRSSGQDDRAWAERKLILV